VESCWLEFLQAEEYDIILCSTQFLAFTKTLEN